VARVPLEQLARRTLPGTLVEVHVTELERRHVVTCLAGRAEHAGEVGHLRVGIEVFADLAMEQPRALRRDPADGHLFDPQRHAGFHGQLAHAFQDVVADRVMAEEHARLRHHEQIRLDLVHRHRLLYLRGLLAAR